MHCHLIISRKDQANKKKLSPLTNHKNTKNGVIKGGFNRVNLFQQVEQKFDRLFNYKRQQTESFDYQNIMKNGSISDQLNLNKQSIISSERNNQINKEYTVENRRVVNQENNQATSSFISLFSSNSDSFTKLQEQRPKKKKRNRRL